MNIPKILYLLEKEIRPNGKVLKFHYSNDIKKPLVRVESMDPQERVIYASLDISSTSNQKLFSTHTGQSANYDFQDRTIQGEYKKNKYKITSPPFLTGVKSPFFSWENTLYNAHLLLVKHDGYGKKFSCTYDLCLAQGEKKSNYRIKTLSLPVGQNDAMHPVYEFYYNPPVPGKMSGFTRVQVSDGTTVYYHFSPSLLIQSIQYLGQNSVLTKEKNYTWNANNQCLSVELKDGRGQLFYRKSFEYDAWGNPVTEIISGELTGQGEKDAYAIKREFSQDGHNLILKEEREGGITICFKYVPQTNLVSEKLIKDGFRTLKREFFEYDDCLNLTLKMIDDGNSDDKNNLAGVTQRHMTKYILRQQAPHLHRPEWIEESYLEEGCEKLLKKTLLTYDRQGNISQEDLFDSSGQYAYTTYKDYNERGDIISETNALGQWARYSYDDKGNRVSETNFFPKAAHRKEI